MLDLSGVSSTEIKAASKKMNRAFWGAASESVALGKLCGIKQTNGLSFTSYPGWSGAASTAKGRNKFELPDIQDLSTYKQTTVLAPIDKVHVTPKDQMAELEPLADPLEDVEAQLVSVWSETLHAAMIELMIDSPGEFGVFKPNYSFSGYDGKVLYSNDHYNGNLDNIAPSTGTTAPDFSHDFWVAWKQLRLSKIPGTNTFFWKSASLASREIFVVVPAALEEVATAILGSEQFLATVNGISYNSPASNLLAGVNPTMLKKPQLIVSPYLDEDSTSKWYLFVTDMGLAPSPHPIQFVFNNYAGPGVRDQESLRQGIDFQFGGNSDKNISSMINVTYHGKGSHSYDIENMAVLKASSYMGIFAAEPYRTIRIGA